MPTMRLGKFLTFFRNLRALSTRVGDFDAGLQARGGTPGQARFDVQRHLLTFCVSRCVLHVEAEFFQAVAQGN